MQKTECSGRFFATKISSPDFVKLASAYGIKAGRVSEPSKLEMAIARALNSKGPYLLEVKISEEAEI
jgi:acetolactate synthase-1/2/3 large subunit